MNTEPEQGEMQPDSTEQNRTGAPAKKAEEIHSKDFTSLKPLFASRYGNSRLFTAQYNGNKVVIKTLKADRANDPRCRASLRSEYDTTCALDNKFFRKALDFTSIEGLGDCIVFEFIEGKSLAEHVRVGTLSEKQVKNILVDVCDALSYLQRNQVVHCNLTPENILVTAEDCRAKLIDLGAPETNQDADRELLIKEMEFVAPEIIKGEEVDSRSDIYSLGKIMEFFAERNISKQYMTVATHCTQFSKEQRYDSVSEVRSAISKGHPAVKTAILLLLLAVLGALAYIYVPKIKSNVERERAVRMAVDFAHKVDNMRDERPALCEKYKLQSLDEPILPDWTADSLRFANSLMPFFGAEDFQAKAMAALKEQKDCIVNSRQKDFNRLLLNEFKAADDSLAVAMKAELPEMDDDMLLLEAQKWHGQMK